MSLLKVENVGKAYRKYRSEWQRIARWFGLPVRPQEEHWVLRQISFEVGAGEAVGIVGHNGAGKSTLLKIVTGTLRPTEGSVAIHGRVAAILELGMGFNAELTGRQNALHAAGLMGFEHQDVLRALPEIEAFAEIGAYFDQPVRTYSSGMQMRVAFAVATAFRPDILIIDEALSVGDTYFQHKSFDRIRQFQQQGSTLLIVSHDRGAIQGICNRAILLNNGGVAKDGDPEEVMDYYNALIAERENSSIETRTLASGKVQLRSGSGEASVESVTLLNARGEPVELINVGEPVALQITFVVHEDLPEVVLGYVLKDRLGLSLFGTNTHQLGQQLRNVRQGERITYTFTFEANLGVGSYSIATALHTSDTHIERNYEWRDLVFTFSVANLDKASFVGMTWLHPGVECSR